MIAGDYPMSYWHDGWGNYNIYIGYWYGLGTSAVEPHAIRFIGKAYNNDMKHSLSHWWFYDRGYSWLGVTDKTKLLFPLSYKGNRI